MMQKKKKKKLDVSLSDEGKVFEQSSCKQCHFTNSNPHMHVIIPVGSSTT
jgi:hypothetical protein